MKKSGLRLLTYGLIAFGTFGIVVDAQAFDDIQLISPPEEQICFQMAAVSNNSQNTEAFQSQVKSKKENILKKINELKNSSSTAPSTQKPTSVTTLGSQPRQLYTLTRLLDYSPHPTTENILKDKPVLYNGRNYHFTVTYNEDWQEVSADSTCLKGISFSINVFENGKRVRNLTTPKVSIDAKKIKKGQYIGIAEVAPFKFNIKVDDITSNKKGVTELIFKLDLIG